MQRDDRLARADVALEEALHRHRAGEVAVDLGDRPLLVGGERERKRVAVTRDELSRRAEWLRRRAFAGCRRTQQGQPKDEQLVEGEARPPDLGLRQRSRAVYGPERIGAHREPLSGEQLGGQVVSEVEHELEYLVVQVAQPLLRDVLRCGIDGREVARLGLAVEVVRRDREAVPVRAPADAEGRSRNELRLEPRLVEPRRLDLAGLVRDPGGEDLQPAPAVARRGPDDALDHRLVVAEEVADALHRRSLLVPPRALPEDVLDDDEAELRETPGE